MGQEHFQYKVLPFDLLSARRGFSKILSVVVAHFYKQGIMMFLYLDDCLLNASSFKDVLAATQKTMDLFLQMGLQLNTQKSTLTPVQQLVFIGSYLDAVEAKAFFPLHRFNALASLISTVQASPQISARTCLQLLGHKGVGTLIVQHARLHLHCLQGWLRIVYIPRRHQSKETSVKVINSQKLSQLVGRFSQSVCGDSLHPTAPHR